MTRSTRRVRASTLTSADTQQDHARRLAAEEAERTKDVVGELVLYGKKLLGDRDYDGALRMSRKALVLDPKNAEARDLLAAAEVGIELKERAAIIDKQRKRRGRHGPISEFDKALGYAGPESMAPLKSLNRRVNEVLGENKSFEFEFELHDFSPQSAVIIDENVHAHSHSDYWSRPQQANFYVNLMNT